MDVKDIKVGDMVWAFDHDIPALMRVVSINSPTSVELSTPSGWVLIDHPDYMAKTRAELLAKGNGGL